MERLLRLILPSQHYHILLIYVGTSNTARYDHEQNSSDNMAIVGKVKELGAQMMFLFILPVQGQSPGRTYTSWR